MEINYQLFCDLEKVGFLSREKLWEELYEKLWLLSTGLKQNPHLNGLTIDILKELMNIVSKISSVYSLMDIENETKAGEAFHAAFSKALSSMNALLSGLARKGEEVIYTWNVEELLETIQEILRCEKELLHVRIIEQAKILGVLE